MGDIAGNETSAWAALRRRKLVQWALAYAAAAWVLLQAASLLAGVYGWPAPALRILTGALFIGFPVALVLAWYHGERGEQRVSSTELLILTLLLALGGGLLWFAEKEKGTGVIKAPSGVRDSDSTTGALITPVPFSQETCSMLR